MVAMSSKVKDNFILTNSHPQTPRATISNQNKLIIYNYYALMAFMLIKVNPAFLGYIEFFMIFFQALSD